MTSTREEVIAKMKAKGAEQPTATLCEAMMLLAALPGSDEGRMARAVTLDVLCERHPEAEAAANAWADSDAPYDPRGYDAAVIGAVLSAIGA